MPSPTIDELGFHLFTHGGVAGLQGWLDFLEDGYHGIYGSEIDVGPDTSDGQLLGLFSQIITDFEQALQAVFSGRAPAGAVGAQLSRLVQLNGLLRKAAQFSTVPITMGGTPGQAIAVNSLIDNPDDPLLPAFKTGGPYTIGGGGTVTGTATCTQAGPFTVAATKLSRIKTITSGWDTVTNTADATPGRLVEADPPLRVRRGQSVAMPSQSMLDGLYAALANLPGVDDVVVYENPNNSTNAKGEPAHSIHVIIDGGVAADIANAIWVKASMGCTKFGAVRFTVTDTQGNPQDMGWDVPIDDDVYITVQLSRTPNSFEVSSIQGALVSYGVETSRIGENVPWADLFSPINDLGITGKPGLPSVLTVKLGNAPSPTLQADLSVPFNARPRYDASRILVVGP